MFGLKKLARRLKRVKKRGTKGGVSKAETINRGFQKIHAFINLGIALNKGKKRGFFLSKKNASLFKKVDRNFPCYKKPTTETKWLFRCGDNGFKFESPIPFNRTVPKRFYGRTK